MGHLQQSHFHEKVWLDNLFINKGINTNGSIQKAKSLISILRKMDAYEKLEAELQNIIGKEATQLIYQASLSVNHVIEKFHLNYVRSQEEEKLIKLLHDNDIEIRTFSRDTLLVLRQQEVIEYLEENPNILETLCDTPEVTIQ